MKLIVQKPFSWAHRGVRVESFEKGATIDTEDRDLIEVSQREGWTKKPGKAAENKPESDAPENE